MTTRLHATAVLVGERAVLFLGPSGSGKSAMAWRLLTRPPTLPGRAAPAPVRLVADDQTLVSAAGGRLIARPHPALAGLLELRGAGIRRMEHEPAAVVGLVAELGPGPRSPDLDQAVILMEGIALPRIWLARANEDGASAVVAELGAGGAVG